ncbi:MAG: septum formation protein Maf [Lachnospiraceae bacterium]|nr:septum formation protein Maf [Lachnospiraceae bacterium]
MEIYLASASPRRRELLDQIGIKYEVRVSGTDENVGLEDPALLVEELSRRKALTVTEELLEEGKTDFIVIGADTVVSCGGKVLGKPAGRADAIRMLGNLSGRSHEVYTGVTVVKKDNAPASALESGEMEGSLNINTFHEETKVTFYEMSLSEINEYVDTCDPMDKAGAYGIQGFCARYIKGIEGDYNNVVGLPIGHLYQLLKNL